MRPRPADGRRCRSVSPSGVEQALQPEITVIAAVTADHELVRARGHVIGGLDVELLLRVEGIPAGIPAETDSSVCRWREGAGRLLRAA